MGIQRENGYSANVEGFFVLENQRVRLAKTNGCTFTVAEPCELPAGTTGELMVILDGVPYSKLVTLPDGAIAGKTSIHYVVAAPF